MRDYFGCLGQVLLWMVTGLPRAALGIVVTVILMLGGAALGVYAGYVLDQQLGIDAVGVAVGGVIIFFYYFTLIYLAVTDRLDRLYGWFFEEV